MLVGGRKRKSHVFQAPATASSEPGKSTMPLLHRVRTGCNPLGAILVPLFVWVVPKAFAQVTLTVAIQFSTSSTGTGPSSEWVVEYAWWGFLLRPLAGAERGCNVAAEWAIRRPSR